MKVLIQLIKNFSLKITFLKYFVNISNIYVMVKVNNNIWSWIKQINKIKIL